MSATASPTQTDLFERLLSRRAEIADFVNSFDSKKNQHAALDALVRAMGVPTTTSVAPPTVTQPLTVVPPLAEDVSDPDAGDNAGDAAKSGRKPRKSTAPRRSFDRVDVNFNPDGKQSLRDFVTEKNPTSHIEKFLVVVYYMQFTLEIDVTVGHIVSAYDAVGWRAPTDPSNTVSQVRSKNGWLDNSDPASIKATHNGQQTVKFDLPTAKDKKSS